MNREEILARIREQALIAIVRVPNATPLVKIAEALAAGGVQVIEFTLTVPGSLEELTRARSELSPDAILGIGTTLDAESARAAILAGAQFVVMPTLNKDAIRLCRRYGIPVIPGAFTPSEILRAWEWGGDMVKVFPASALGPNYCKDLRSPLPQIPLVPTGGITLDNLTDYLRAGAAAVGVGSDLVKQDAVNSANWSVLTDRASQFVARIKETTQDNWSNPPVEEIP